MSIDTICRNDPFIFVFSVRNSNAIANYQFHGDELCSKVEEDNKKTTTNKNIETNQMNICST